jgi:type I pantothenate kinase
MGDDPEGIDPQTPMPWSHVAEVLRVRASIRDTRPFIVGIAGPVSVGKSTLAGLLQAELDGPMGNGVLGPVEVLGTDGFLFPNDELQARNLVLRKGFPESYDGPLLERTLDSLRAGREVSVPVYSHETYDIVPGAARAIRHPATLILEGVNALRFRDRLDYAIYIDAPVAAIEEWFVTRLVELVAEAPAGSFYAGWSGFTGGEVDALAHDIWRTINAVNLEECIEPTRAVADLVVEKGPNHELVAVRALRPEV